MGSRPRPIKPAAQLNMPWLFWPQPKRKLGNTSVGVRVRVSLSKYPAENEESSYWMPHTHVDDEHLGVLPVKRSFKINK